MPNLPASLVSTPLEEAATAVILLSALLTALGFVFRKVYRAFKMGELAFSTLIGTADQPSVREQLDTVQGHVDTLTAGQVAALTNIDAVKVIALRSERELHPNGGSSLRDDIRSGLAGAQQAKELAAQAVQRAQDTANAVSQVGEDAARERQEIRDAMLTMKDDITAEAAGRYADALDLLAEHGGPDLRPHFNADEVIPHVHVLPPETTSGPVLPEEAP